MKRPEAKLASGRQSKPWPPARPPSNLDVDEKLDFVMAEIEAELAAGKKPFSPSGRRPNVQMVLWRAGFSPAFLEAKRVSEERDRKQAERKDKIQRWLASIFDAESVDREADRNAREQGPISDNTIGPRGELDDYKQYIHDLELELVEANARIAELTAKRGL